MADASAQMVGTYSTSFACMTPSWHADANGYIFGVAVGHHDADVRGLHRDRHVHRDDADVDDDQPVLRDGAPGRRLRQRLRLPPRHHQQPATLRAGHRRRCLPGGHAAQRLVHRLHRDFACNPCSCGQPVGAGCSDVGLAIGTDGISARDVVVRLAPRHVCAAPNALNSPSIVFTGTPTAPTCAPQRRPAAR